MVVYTNLTSLLTQGQKVVCYDSTVNRGVCRGDLCVQTLPSTFSSELSKMQSTGCSISLQVPIPVLIESGKFGPGIFVPAKFFHQLGVGQLSNPWGIAIHGDGVYVSCWGDHTVTKFSLTELCRVRRIGGQGSNSGQFNCPRQLTTDPVGRVFI